jgi:hypothetical protein
MSVRNTLKIHDTDFHNAPTPTPPKTERGEASTSLASDKHFGARRSLRIGKHAVFLHDQRTAQRDHHQDAKNAAGKREHRDLDVVEISRTVGREEDQRGHSEHDAARNRLARGSDRLDDVVFQNRGAAKLLEHRDREDGDGNRCAHGEAGAQTEIHGRRAEQQAEQRPENDGARGELGG